MTDNSMSARPSKSISVAGGAARRANMPSIKSVSAAAIYSANTHHLSPYQARMLVGTTLHIRAHVSASGYLTIDQSRALADDGKVPPIALLEFAIPSGGTPPTKSRTSDIRGSSLSLANIGSC